MDRPVLLVEGESDAAALAALSRLLDAPAAADSIVVMHGITNLRRHLRDLPPGSVVGVLHDAGESEHVRQVLHDSPARVATFECVADLEDELIRALGTKHAVDVVEAGGDASAWRTIGRQPFHRDRPDDQVLRRFLGAGSGRKKKYAALLAAALAPAQVPAPLLHAVHHAAAA